jgi:hypothetical protein
MKYTAATKTRNIHDNNYPIIVHSHLRWDWGCGNDLSNFFLASQKKHRILFIEAPYSLRRRSKCARIASRSFRLSKHHGSTNADASHAFARRCWVDKEQRRLVQSILAGPLGRSFASPVQWFYDPMAVTAFAGGLNARAIVYDCMDELSLFRGAPPELVKRERELLAAADVVFAGGPKIWKAKKELNDNCFMFGCGVDASHFGRARDVHLSAPADTKSLGPPIVRYFGVVDERLDYELLERLSDATAGSVVMVGPSTKIDPASLPQRANLHWLGGRDYSDLPAYAKTFDVCLMPFAMKRSYAIYQSNESS